MVIRTRFSGSVFCKYNNQPKNNQDNTRIKEGIEKKLNQREKSIQYSNKERIEKGMLERKARAGLKMVKEK